MTDIAEENLRILAERWPTVARRILAAPAPEPSHWRQPAGGQATLEVAGHRLWSAYDAEMEGRMQAERIPAASRRASVYGVGGGDLIRAVLQRDGMREVKVVVMNHGLTHLLLHTLDHRDWLSDPRVTLLDGESEPGPRTPFAVVPPCLSLCSGEAGRLRDQLTVELILPFERERQALLEPQRRRRISENAALIEADGDVRELFASAPSSTAIVAIAGPTLRKGITTVSMEPRRGPVIAVDGALQPLLDSGLVPDVVVSVDENRDTILRYFSCDLSRCAGSTLVYTPLVHRDILTRWPGRRLTTYTFEAIYEQTRHLKPKGELFVAGSVSHPAVDLAVKMGATRVMLLGADFGFPDGRIHANPEAPVDFYANAAQAGVTAKNGRGETIPTLSSFNGYRLGLEAYIAGHQSVEFTNASRDGARIRGARYIDGEDR